jgi:hypothetical protein
MSRDNSSNSFPPPPPPADGKMDVKVIALGVICIVLAAALISVIVLYQPNNSQAQITDKNKTISSLQKNIAALQNYLTGNISEISTYQEQISSLNTKLTNSNATIAQDNATLTQDSAELTQYQNITSLGASDILINQQLITISSSNATNAYDNSLNYCGYLVIQATSTSKTTYAQTIYSTDGVDFNQTVILGTSGSAVFPVISSSTAPTTVDVRIGNSDQAASNSTVTLTYHY